MKRKLAIIGLASPILIGVCVFIFLLMGMVGWLFFRTDEGEIVKVATVGPFFSVKVFQEEPSPTPRPVTTPESESQSQPQPTPAAPQEIDASANLEADRPSISPEAIEAELGFALPANSVNSVTQDGVANRLVIPKLDLDSVVVIAPIENQTWKVDHLEQTIGHLEGTARPGSDSNIVLAAHVTLDTGEYGPFAGLGNLAPGDTLYVYDGGQKFEYIIDSHQTVDRTAVEVTYPSETGQITLITCNNWNAQEGRYIERLIVKGRLVGKE